MCEAGRHSIEQSIALIYQQIQCNQARVDVQLSTADKGDNDDRSLLIM